MLHWPRTRIRPRAPRAKERHDHSHDARRARVRRRRRTPPLQAEQLRLLFRFSLVGYLATLLVVFILGAILWEDLARPALFAWFVAISLVAIGRYLIYKAFIHSDPPPERRALWERPLPRGHRARGRVLGDDRHACCCPMRTRMVQRLSVVMLVMLLMTGAVAYYAPHRYAYKIIAFLGPRAARGHARRLGRPHADVPLGRDPAPRGVLPYVHARVHRALVESLTTRRARDVALHRARERAQPPAGSERGARRGDDRAAEGAAGASSSPRRSCACTSSARRSR